MKDIAGRRPSVPAALDTSNKVDQLPARHPCRLGTSRRQTRWRRPQRVRQRLDELKKYFSRTTLDYVIALDMTPFIQESINEVIRTLFEAIVLVAIVVLVFLQNWRSAIIPLVAVAGRPDRHHSR